MRRIPHVLAAITFVLATQAPGAEPGLVKHKDWAKSPEFIYLATPGEVQEWKGVSTEAEADRFIARFWERRDPDPKTPANEFRERFELLAAEADRRFALPGTRGALTERGKLLILLGPPKLVARMQGSTFSSAFRPPRPGDTGSRAGAADTSFNEAVIQFTYEADQLPEWAGVKSLVASFFVDGATDPLVGPEDVRRLEALAAKLAIRDPGLREFPAAAAAGAVPGATTAPTPGGAPRLPATPAAIAALDEAIAKEPFGAVTVLPLQPRTGGPQLLVQLFAEGLPAGEPARLAGLVKAKDGREVFRAEDAAEPRQALGGVVVERSIPVTPGEYDVAFALLDASGAVTSTAKRSVTVRLTPGGLAASPLLLAVASLPADRASAGAPFVFGDRKFVARGDARFRKTDGISYFVRVYNPAVDPATKKALVRHRVRVLQKGQTPVDLEAAPDVPMTVWDASAGLPYVDVAGVVVDDNVGDVFPPGDYTLQVTLEDTVRKSKVEVAQPFVLAYPKR
jgi:GWxTD domain-containing protein